MITSILSGDTPASHLLFAHIFFYSEAAVCDLLLCHISLGISTSRHLRSSPQVMIFQSTICASWLRLCSSCQPQCGKSCSRDWWTTTGCWRSLLPWWRSWSRSSWAIARGLSSSWDSGPGWVIFTVCCARYSLRASFWCEPCCRGIQNRMEAMSRPPKKIRFFFPTFYLFIFYFF